MNGTDTSPKSATKSAKGEGNSKATRATSSKRKRTTGKDKDQTTKGQSEEVSAEIPKKKSKIDPAPSASQENIIDSVKSFNQDSKHVDKEPVTTRNNTALSLLDIISSSSLNELKLASCKAVTEQRTRERDYFEETVKLKEEEIKRLLQKCVDAEKKFEEKVAEVEKKAFENRTRERDYFEGIVKLKDEDIKRLSQKCVDAEKKIEEKVAEVEKKAFEKTTREINYFEEIVKLKEEEIKRLLQKCVDAEKKFEEEVAEVEKKAFEKTTRERNYFEEIVKLKEEEIKLLSQKCVHAEKKIEEKVSEVEKKASEKIETLEEKHRALLEELSRIKLEKILAVEEKEKNWRERVWSLKYGLPFYVKLLHDCPEYLKGMAMVQKGAMAMGQAEASKLWKEAFVNGSLNEEMMKVEGNVKETFLQCYADFNEMEWPFIQKIVAHAEAPLDELKSLRPDGV